MIAQAGVLSSKSNKKMRSCFSSFPTTHVNLTFSLKKRRYVSYDPLLSADDAGFDSLADGELYLFQRMITTPLFRFESHILGLIARQYPTHPPPASALCDIINNGEQNVNEIIPYYVPRNGTGENSCHIRR